MAIINGTTGNDILNGTADSDTIHGDSGNDVINGGDGNDLLFGDKGDDILYGGVGNDILNGGRGNDVLTGGPGVDTFVMSQGSDSITDFSPALTTTEIVDFEGLIPSYDAIEVPNGYAGLNWSNVNAVGQDNVSNWNGSGYLNVIHSPTTSANATSFGETGSFSSASGDTFDLQNGYFAAAWNNDLTITFLAYDHGAQVGEATVVVNPTQTFVNFHDQTAQGAISAAFSGRFTNIDQVSICGAGGTDANPLDGSGTQVAMDDLKLIFHSGEGDVIQVPAGTDVSQLVASAKSNHAGGTVLSGVPGFGPLTLDNTAPSQVQNSWFVTS